jgi:hypothetical protein
MPLAVRDSGHSGVRLTFERSDRRLLAQSHQSSDPKPDHQRLTMLSDVADSVT